MNLTFKIKICLILILKIMLILQNKIFLKFIFLFWIILYYNYRKQRVKPPPLIIHSKHQKLYFYFVESTPPLRNLKKLKHSLAWN